MAGVIITNISMAADNPCLQKELREKLILDLSEVQLDADHQDFVVVSFHICDDKIAIVEVTGTQKQLVQKVKQKLLALCIEEGYDETQLYRYKFTFEKI